ncbi:hypothetical protein CL619_01335 [archaeon]|nr:hypothetical protein [archaeon]|tara:strand:+ start:682 stop:2511 length:1830 start_codon:yes stop_codon:yes gene_type:complete
MTNDTHEGLESMLLITSELFDNSHLGHLNPPDYLPSDGHLDAIVDDNLATDQAILISDFYDEILAGVNSKVKLDSIKTKYQGSGVAGFDDFLDKMGYAWSWEKRIDVLEDFQKTVLDQFKVEESQTLTASEGYSDLTELLDISNTNALKKIEDKGFSYIVNAEKVHSRLTKLDNFYNEQQTQIEGIKNSEKRLSSTSENLESTKGPRIDVDKALVETNRTLDAIFAETPETFEETVIPEPVEDVVEQDTFQMREYVGVPKSHWDVADEVFNLFEYLARVVNPVEECNDYLTKRSRELIDLGWSKESKLGDWYSDALSSAVHFAKQSGTVIKDSFAPSGIRRGEPTFYSSELDSIETITMDFLAPILGFEEIRDSELEEEKSSTLTLVPGQVVSARLEELDKYGPEIPVEKILKRGTPRVNFGVIGKAVNVAAAILSVGIIGAVVAFYFNEVGPRLDERTITLEGTELLMGNISNSVNGHTPVPPDTNPLGVSSQDANYDESPAYQFMARIGEEDFLYNDLGEIPVGMTQKEFQAQGFPDYVVPPTIFDTGIGLDSAQVMDLGERSYATLAPRDTAQIVTEKKGLGVDDFTLDYAKMLDELGDGVVDMQI